VWVIKGILFLLLLFVLVYFFVTNGSQTVDVNLLGHQYLDLNVFWVVAAAFALGFLTALVIMSIREWRLRRELRRLRRESRVRDRELADLRTLPLQDLAREDG